MTRFRAASTSTTHDTSSSVLRPIPTITPTSSQGAPEAISEQRNMAGMTVNNANVGGPSIAPPLRRAGRKEKGARRPRSTIDPAKLEKVKMAKKVEERRGGRSRHRKDGSLIIFVGNLPGNINEKTLRNAFSQCGTIATVSIRCSRGQAATVPQPMLDRKYAVLAFSEHSAVRKALLKNGSLLEELALVVTLSPMDLPEVTVILGNRHKFLHPHRNVELVPTVVDSDLSGAGPSMGPRPNIPGPPRRCAFVHRAEVRATKLPAKNVIMGVSFAKTVM